MTDKRDEFEVSWINQPYVVDFEVPETALARAHKRWRMIEDNPKSRGTTDERS
jgi:hypothetical protein